MEEIIAVVGKQKWLVKIGLLKVELIQGKIRLWEQALGKEGIAMKKKRKIDGQVVRLKNLKKTELIKQICLNYQQIKVTTT